MDDYTREMMELKTLVTRTLEKKGVLARIRAELRANVFAAIEEEDRALENEGNSSFALLGTCNERAKQLHASSAGKLLTALICDYFEWCQLEHTLKVYLPECNLPQDFWKFELKEKFGQKYDIGGSKDTESPLLLKILETYLKHEQHSLSSLSGSFTKLGIRKTTTTEISSNLGVDESQADIEKPVRRQSGTFAGSLPPVGRRGGIAPISQANAASVPARNYNVGSANEHHILDAHPNACNEMGTGARIGSFGTYGVSSKSRSLPSMKREEHSKRHVDDDSSKDVLGSIIGPENVEPDRKDQSLNSSWRKHFPVTLYSDNSLENTEEEIVEEEEVYSERESC